MSQLKSRLRPEFPQCTSCLILKVSKMSLSHRGAWQYCHFHHWYCPGWDYISFCVSFFLSVSQWIQRKFGFRGRTHIFECQFKHFLPVNTSCVFCLRPRPWCMSFTESNLQKTSNNRFGNSAVLHLKLILFSCYGARWIMSCQIRCWNDDRFKHESAFNVHQT